MLCSVGGRPARAASADTARRLLHTVRRAPGSALDQSHFSSRHSLRSLSLSSLLQSTFLPLLLPYLRSRHSLRRFVCCQACCNSRHRTCFVLVLRHGHRAGLDSGSRSVSSFIKRMVCDLLCDRSSKASATTCSTCPSVGRRTRCEPRGTKSNSGATHCYGYPGPNPMHCTSLIHTPFVCGWCKPRFRSRAWRARAPRRASLAFHPS